MLTVPHLLYEAAGRPRAHVATRPKWYGEGDGPCWWCGEPCAGPLCRTRKSIPGTFPGTPPPACPDSAWLCAPCAWTLCDTVLLPPDRGEAQLRSRATKGGRATVCVGEADAERLLVAELEDGRVGLWRSSGNASSEKPWHELLDELRAAPRDVGAIEYVGAVPYAELSPAPAAKFRNYHHFGTAARGSWRPWTSADKAEIRAWLLDPPSEPWAGIIGDGQKHGAIHAEASPGYPVAWSGDLFDADQEDLVQAVYFCGAQVYYRPAELQGLLEAVEALVGAGARDEEITSGAYAPRDLGLLLAVRQHDPVAAVWRGGPTLDLALWLRRPVAEIRAEPGGQRP